MFSDKRYQVFLSSTYDDIRVERQQATQSILALGHLPAGMELFPASDLSQWELIKRVIMESDYYVVMVAGRYGSMHPDTGISFTEMEYDFALANDVPVLGFIRNDISNLPVKYAESTDEGREKLESFRSKVMQRHCNIYNESAELGGKVMQSLVTETRINPRMGWVRANQARSAEDLVRERALKEELDAAHSAISKLQRKIRDVSIEVEGLRREDLAQGQDVHQISVGFTNNNKDYVIEVVEITWDEIFSAIGPSMYGYVLRRFNYQGSGEYTFYPMLVEAIRSKIFDRAANRKINLPANEVDTILIQFKQLGYVELAESMPDSNGKTVRGYTLSELGEQKVTRLKVASRV
jgi:hypothetical protein